MGVLGWAFRSLVLTSCLFVFYLALVHLLVHTAPNICSLHPVALYYIEIPIPFATVSNNPYNYRLFRAIDERDSTCSPFITCLSLVTHTNTPTHARTPHSTHTRGKHPVVEHSALSSSTTGKHTISLTLIVSLCLAFLSSATLLSWFVPFANNHVSDSTLFSHPQFGHADEHRSKRH
jgi:hypothetical protein